MKLKSKIGASIPAFPLEQLKDVFIIIGDEKDNSQNQYFKAKKKIKDAIKDILLIPDQVSKRACVPSKSLFFYITKHAINANVIDHVETTIRHIGNGRNIQKEIIEESVSCKQDLGVSMGREGKESSSFDPAINKKGSEENDKIRITKCNTKRQKRSSSSDKNPLKVKFKKMGMKEGEHGGDLYTYEHSDSIHNGAPAKENEIKASLNSIKKCQNTFNTAVGASLLLGNTSNSENKTTTSKDGEKASGNLTGTFQDNVGERNKQCFVLLQRLTIDEVISHISKYSVVENCSSHRSAIEIDNDISNQHFIKKGSNSTEPQTIRFTRDHKKNILRQAKLHSFNEQKVQESPYEHILEDRTEAHRIGDVLQECSNKIILNRKVDTINQNIQEHDFIKPGERAYVSLRGDNIKRNNHGIYKMPPKHNPVSQVVSTEWNNEHNKLEHTTEMIKSQEMNHSEKVSSESTEFDKENVFWWKNSAENLRAGSLNTNGSNVETNVEIIPKLNKKGAKGCGTHTLSAIQTDSLLEGSSKETLIMGKSECEFCKKKFWDQYSLKCHMAIHSKEKPQFKCELCDYERYALL